MTKKMRVLIACEFSGTVRDAFAARGHEAWSCDLLESETPGNHIQGDVLDVIGQDWDLMIAHPPCTYLAVSGMHWTTRGLRDPKLTENALEFVRKLLEAPIPKIALENPISIISTKIRKPNQIVQPWFFGHDASKKTCLWLKNLLPLSPTKIIPPKGWHVVKYADECPLCDCCGAPWCVECDCIGPTMEEATYAEIEGVLFGFIEELEENPGRPLWGNQTPSGQNKLGPSKDRWKIRSRTYSGLAQAMANQWG